MRKYFHKRIVFTVVVLFSLFACESDYLEINTDPNNPTEAPSDQVLTNVQVQIANTMSMGGSGLSSALSTYMHQTVQYRNSAFYAVTGSDYVISVSWGIFYNNILEDLRLLIEKQNAAGNLKYVGVGKILKAYTYGQMVNVWGDIPFSEANRMPDIRFPKFDNDADIYSAIITLLDSGIADIKNEDAANVRVPASDDLFYGGDDNSWIALANSVKLQLYNNMRLVEDVSSEVTALLEENLISSSDLDFELEYGTSQEPENRNPGYVNEYTNATMEYYISPWFYEIMKGWEGGDLAVVNPMEGIVDPRIPYYWFNQVTVDEAADVSQIEYSDDNFISIYFGGTGVFHGSGKDTEGTVPGLFPIGGRFDDQKGTDGDGVGVDYPGPGNVPMRLLTYYKMLFVRAELAQEGVSSENARELFEAAMRASFAKVNQVVEDYLPSQDNDNVPVISDADIDTYVNAVLLRYDAADSDGQLQLIMTQKWIATFGNSVDQYSDYRRTGYPVLYDPNADSLEETEVTRSFPLALPYSSNDLKINPNSPPEQRKPAVDGVFWDVNN
jgi:hypothetical protein